MASESLEPPRINHGIFVQVTGSTAFVFTAKAKSKPVKGENPCLLWSEGGFEIVTH